MGDLVFDLFDFDFAGIYPNYFVTQLGQSGGEKATKASHTYDDVFHSILGLRDEYPFLRKFITQGTGFFDKCN